MINKSEIRESEGSRAGLKYIAANDGRIANKWEYDSRLKKTEGNSEDFTFQIAEVNKALGSESYLVDPISYSSKVALNPSFFGFISL